MHDPSDDFEPQLRDYLSSRLDGQLGKAAEHFAASPSIDQAAVSPREKPPRHGRLIAAVAAAAAAIALAVWCGVEAGKRPVPKEGAAGEPKPPSKVRDVAEEPRKPSSPQVVKSPDSPGTKLLAHAEPLLVGQQFQWRTIDEGIVYLDPNTPVRKLRRQRLERVEWYDAARGARVQMIVPREEIQFVSLPSS